MKIIRVSTDMELSVHDFPEGTTEQQNEILRELIGADCRLYEHVMPRRLYSDLHMKNHITNKKGECVSMLVDEEFMLKPGVSNLIGSYLYETDKHGNPILGNILFVGEVWNNDGIDFCGIEETTCEQLELQLNNMIYAMKATKEAVREAKEGKK